ncbi:FRG domain-containing protein [Mycolicibacterium sp. J2]|uniref:FRG domain-containing protein n=1 Tax=Mycolicibacterium sp. J2 TaxID=2993511 RepID=UPI00224B7579|nr:FRG domain-containing protein [Mycolicibacterium sp. J2]MCX2713767.1 FRG domain-containing protein [Mycolicibacterium sp. J2]
MTVEVEFSDLADLIKKVVENRPNASAAAPAANNGNEDAGDAALQAVVPSNPVWFRGIKSEAYALVPKLHRGATDVEVVRRREARLLARFAERSMPFWTPGYPRDDWSFLFSMQHYGAPTRLLDWSENLLVAAYFSALPYDSGEERDQADDGRPAVWAFEPVRWNSLVLEHIDADLGILTTSDPEIKSWEPRSTEDLAAARRLKQPIALYGIHNNPRIVAQRGTFTIAGSMLEPLEDIATEKYPAENLLTKYVFTGERSEFAEQMRAVGVQKSMIFPDLQSLSEEISIMEGW